MKKLFTLLVAFCATVTMWANGIEVDSIYYIFAGDSAAVTYSGANWSDAKTYTGTITIPESVTYSGKTYRVTGIGNFAFEGSTITDVNLPATIHYIGRESFSYCGKLQECIIPDSVTSIGIGAFYYCTKLTTIVVPENVASLGTGAFGSCTKLTSVTWNAKKCAGFTEEKYAPFEGMVNITSFIVGESVEKIPNYLCADMTGLTTLTISDNVKTIGKNAFANCTALTTVNIPCGITSMSSDAFAGCTALDTVIWNARKCADFSSTSPFDGLTNITTFTIGDSVIYIPSYLCYRMSNLSSVAFGTNVTGMGEYVFTGCTGISQPLYNQKIFAYLPTSYSGTYTIPAPIKTIAGYAFYSCRGITSIVIPSYVDSIGISAFQYCTGLTSANLSNGLSKINKHAFHYCTGITSISIPSSISVIGDSAFYHCNGLTSVKWNVINYADYKSQSKTPFYGVSNISAFAFGDSVQHIPAYLCQGMTLVDSITIPQNTKAIGNYTFADCTGLKYIKSDAIIAPTIGPSTFNNINSMTVEIPCDSTQSYVTTWPSRYTYNEPAPDFSMIVTPNDELFGGVTTIKKLTCYNYMPIIKAVPNYGYHFTQWSDGNIENPRTIAIDKDTILSAIFTPNTYSIYTTANNADYGITYGDTTVNYKDTVTIYASANYGYHFTYWNDRNTSNPRQIVVTGDKTYTAQFAKNQYKVTVNVANGTVSGVGTYTYLSNATLTVNPEAGYRFLKWSDGNTDNPRILTITQDTTLTAETEKPYRGKCGNTLYWEYTNKVLNITGNGAMYDYTTDSVPWIQFRDSIKTIVFPDSITTVGNYAFYKCNALTTVSTPYLVNTVGTGAFKDCTGLRSIYMGTGTTTIGANAFAGDTRIYDITCYATDVPIAQESSFANYNAYLHVPCGAERYYSIDPVFCKFSNTECFGTGTSSTDTFAIVGGQTDVTFEWPASTNAETYTMTITKDGVVFCTLTFNAQGQLVNIAFAPARGASNAQEVEQTANGFKFTVTGLNSDTEYGYEFKALDGNKAAVATYTGTFNTTATGLEEIEAEGSIVKYIENGKLYIMRNGVKFDASGRVVK